MQLKSSTLRWRPSSRAKGSTASTTNQDMPIEGNLAAGELPANADIETLPPDESSETSSDELAKGSDNPDVNDLNASSNSH